MGDDMEGVAAAVDVAVVVVGLDPGSGTETDAPLLPPKRHDLVSFLGCSCGWSLSCAEGGRKGEGAVVVGVGCCVRDGAGADRGAGDVGAAGGADWGIPEEWA